MKKAIDPTCARATAPEDQNPTRRGGGEVSPIDRTGAWETGKDPLSKVIQSLDGWETGGTALNSNPVHLGFSFVHLPCHCFPEEPPGFLPLSPLLTWPRALEHWPARAELGELPKLGSRSASLRCAGFGLPTVREPALRAPAPGPGCCLSRGRVSAQPAVWPYVLW